MGKPRAPAPPDPKATAAAQTGTNVSTAVANQIGGMVNQYGPDGSLEFKQQSQFDWVDPSTGQSYSIPRFAAVTTLDPTQTTTNEINKQAEQNLSTLGRDQSARLQGLLSEPVSMGGLPQRANAPRPVGLQTGPNSVDLAGSIEGAGDITRTYGTDFSQDRQRVEDALMSRLNPSLERDREALRTSLLNQGVREGTEAFDRAMNRFGEQSNDARMSAILAGGQEQSRLVGLEAGRAGFENAAQGQQFGQNAAQAAFGNEAALAGFGATLQGNAANNQVAQAGFNNELARANFQAQKRGTALDERMMARNQPINEITALLSGSQVSQPRFAQTPGVNIPTTDFAGLAGQQYAGQMAGYQQQMAGRNSLIGGLFGLGAAGLTGAGAAGGFGNLFGMGR